MDECGDAFGNDARFYTLNTNGGYCNDKIGEANGNKPPPHAIMDYISSSLYFSGYAFPLHLSTINGSHFLYDETAISPRKLIRHCDLLQISTGSNRSRPPSVVSFGQSRRHIQAEKCPFFTKTSDYLRYFILNRRLKMALHTTETISK